MLLASEVAAGGVAGVARGDKLCVLVEQARQEAKQRLAEIYGWFTEGFETADLQEARALLREL